MGTQSAVESVTVSRSAFVLGAIAVVLPLAFLTAKSGERTLKADEMAMLRGGQVAGYCCEILSECEESTECATETTPCTAKEHVPQAGNDLGCVEGAPTEFCDEDPGQPSACNVIYNCKAGEMDTCERGDLDDYVYAAIGCGPDYCNEE